MIMRKRRRPSKSVACILLAGILTCSVLFGYGCTDPGVSTDASSDTTESDAAQETQGNSQEQSGIQIDMDGMDFEYSDRDKDASYDASSATKIALDGETASVQGDGAQANGSVVTISQEGTYVVSGVLKDGQLVVDAAEDQEVQIVLDVASIHNESGPALYVEQADKVFITLQEGTKNFLSDGSGYASAEDDGVPNAALYAECDLTINGSGSLDVAGGSCHAIHTKDDLAITGGTIAATSEQDALRGRDSVKIAGGTFDLSAGGDAIKANNGEDGTRGFVCIDGGSFAIEAGDDAVHAESVLMVNDGQIQIDSCEEGLEAEQIYLNGGDVRVTSNDDGVNASARDATASNGREAEVQAAESRSADAAVADADRPAEGDSSQEGGIVSEGDALPERPAGAQDGQLFESEGQPQLPQDGSVAPQGGIDSVGNADAEKGVEGRFAPQVPAGGKGAVDAGMPGASESCIVSISGGRLLVESGGDGIDSNGSLVISGGTVLVCIPESGEDSPIDYEYSAEISGGYVLALGAAGMAQGFTGGGQASVAANVSGSAGDDVCLVDANGKVVVSLKAINNFSWVCASCTGMEDGAQYSLVVGGTVSDADSDGFSQSGSVEGGNSTQLAASASTAAEGAGTARGRGL